jgi:hypothetical protein
VRRTIFTAHPNFKNHWPPGCLDFSRWYCSATNPHDGTSLNQPKCVRANNNKFHRAGQVSFYPLQVYY